MRRTDVTYGQLDKVLRLSVSPVVRGITIRLAAFTSTRKRAQSSCCPRFLQTTKSLNTTSSPLDRNWTNSESLILRRSPQNFRRPADTRGATCLADDRSCGASPNRDRPRIDASLSDLIRPVAQLFLQPGAQQRRPAPRRRRRHSQPFGDLLWVVPRHAQHRCVLFVRRRPAAQRAEAGTGPARASAGSTDPTDERQPRRRRAGAWF